MIRRIGFCCQWFHHDRSLKKKQLEEIKTKYQGAITKSEIEDYTKKVEEERKQAFEIANLYIKAHRDFLKQTQQNLEMVIFTEELLSQKIKT